MNVQNLKLQFSSPDVRPNNVVKTQIPVPRFGRNNSSDSLLNGNPTPNQSFLHSNSNNSVKSPAFNSSPSQFNSQNNFHKSPTFNSSPSLTNSQSNFLKSPAFNSSQLNSTVKSPNFSPSQLYSQDKSVKSFTFNSSPAPFNSQNNNVKSPIFNTSQNNSVKSPTFNNSQNNLIKSPTFNNSQNNSVKSPTFNNSQNSFVKSPTLNSTPSQLYTQKSSNKSPIFNSNNSLKTSSNLTSPLSVSQNNQTPQQRTTSPDRWKNKFDDAEKKRKTLLTQNQKLNRDHEELQRRYNQAQREADNVKRELNDRETQLNQLRKLSEAVYKEYDQLKNQYELETGTMQKAMQKASQWYKQNRELKRQSSVLMQRVMQFDPQSAPELTNDETDSGVSTDNDEFEDLRKTVQDLNKDVARLQAEVNAAKLQEFEAQETIVDLTSQLEEERNARVLLESELKELRSLRDNFGQVSRLVAAEVTSLREQCVREKETAQRMKEDADKAKKERNVMAHQSQLLMCEVADNERLIQVLMEVEVLKRSLEEEKQRHASEIQTLQENLEDREEEPHIELLQEKLKLAEGELQCALERAERAETFSKQLTAKVSKLEEDLEKSSQAMLPPPPPPPPMPPPPPPLPSLSQPAPVSLRRRPNCDGAESSSVDHHTSSAVLEMANLLGIPPRKSSIPAVPGAIDDIINEIKGGRFTLKSTEPKPRLSKVDEQPPVVQEMINVLGTLRKRRTPSMKRKQENSRPDNTL